MDGDQPLAFSRREGKYMEAAQPDLILLDLNLPKKDGRAVLLELKDDPALRKIPVMILTSSPSREDWRQAATVGCSALSQQIDWSRGVLLFHRERVEG